MGCKRGDKGATGWARARKAWSARAQQLRGTLYPRRAWALRQQRVVVPLLPSPCAPRIPTASAPADAHGAGLLLQQQLDVWGHQLQRHLQDRWAAGHFRTQPALPQSSVTTTLLP